MRRGLVAALVAGGDHERRHILHQRRGTAQHRVRADAHELVHARHAAQDCPIAHFHVAGDLRVAGEHRVVADAAIVRDVHVGHDPVVIADGRDADILRGAGMDRGEFADGVAVADDEPGRLVAILHILRPPAHRREVADLVVAAQRGVALDHGMVADARPRIDAHIRADHGKGADLDIRGQFGLRVDHRGRVNLLNLRHASPLDLSSRTAHMISASAATSSSTVANTLNFHMPLLERSSSAFSTS